MQVGFVKGKIIVAAIYQKENEWDSIRRPFQQKTEESSYYALLPQIMTSASFSASRKII